MLGIIQNGYLLIVKILLPIMFPVTVEGRESYRKISRPFLIVANHSSLFDIFAIFSSFSWPSHFFPFRVVMWHKLYRFLPVWILFSLIWGIEVVKIKGSPLEKSLEDPLRFLKKRKGVLGIFPQGKRIRLGRPRHARPGVAYLALKTGTPIVPVYILGLKGVTPEKFFKRKIKVFVRIGEPFDVNGSASNLLDIDTARRLIHSKLEELKSKNSL